MVKLQGFGPSALWRLLIVVYDTKYGNARFDFWVGLL
jgi:hypothetical protein